LAAILLIPGGISRSRIHIQRSVKRTFVLLVFLVLNGSAMAYPIEPDAETLIKAFERQDNDFPPARVGWQKKDPKPINPVLESLRYPYTREAMSAQIQAWATPDWRLMAMFGLLIFALRYYRYRESQTAEAAIRRPASGQEVPVEPKLAA
jgi:hypothetical protein